MSEEQALVYVETIKAMLESVEKDEEEEEEEEVRDMLRQRKLEEAEREYALRNLLRRGDFSFVKEGGGEDRGVNVVVRVVSTVSSTEIVVTISLK